MTIAVTDDTGGSWRDTLTVRLEAGAAVELDALDLELGNRMKGLPRGTGPGAGAWNQVIRSDGIEFDALVYARDFDGFRTPMRSGGPGDGDAPSHGWGDGDRLRTL